MHISYLLAAALVFGPEGIDQWLALDVLLHVDILTMIVYLSSIAALQHCREGYDMEGMSTREVDNTQRRYMAGIGARGHAVTDYP